MQVLLLGAGASKAYSQSSTGQRMPVAADFFCTFERLDIYNNTWVLREGLYDFITRVKGEDPDTYLKKRFDIEALYSEIEEYFLSVPSDDDNRLEKVLAFRPYTEMSCIFTAVVNEIQNGPMSKPHLELCRHIGKRDAVITFNWDTLMDRALQSSAQWSVDSGYGFRPRSVFRNEWCAPIDEELKGPLLLKLHGSSNWITSYMTLAKGDVGLMQLSSPDSVWVYEKTDRPYDCYAGRYMPGYEPFSFGYYPPNLLDDRGRAAPEGHLFVRVRPRVPWKAEGTAGDKGLVSYPLIIPPVKKKKYDMFGSLFRDLWQKAEDALAEADHILLIGYSFPITDVRSASLFISAFMRRNTVPTVTIINPNPDPVRDRMIYEFGIPRSNIRVYKDYFSEDFDVERAFAR